MYSLIQFFINIKTLLFCLSHKEIYIYYIYMYMNELMNE